MYVSSQQSVTFSKLFLKEIFTQNLKQELGKTNSGDFMDKANQWKHKIQLDWLIIFKHEINSTLAAKIAKGLF